MINISAEDVVSFLRDDLEEKIRSEKKRFPNIGKIIWNIPRAIFGTSLVDIMQNHVLVIPQVLATATELARNENVEVDFNYPTQTNPTNPDQGGYQVPGPGGYQVPGPGPGRPPSYWPGMPSPTPPPIQPPSNWPRPNPPQKKPPYVRPFPMPSPEKPPETKPIDEPFGRFPLPSPEKPNPITSPGKKPPTQSDGTELPFTDEEYRNYQDSDYWMGLSNGAQISEKGSNKLFYFVIFILLFCFFVGDKK